MVHLCCLEDSPWWGFVQDWFTGLFLMVLLDQSLAELVRSQYVYGGSGQFRDLCGIPEWILCD